MGEWQREKNKVPFASQLAFTKRPVGDSEVNWRKVLWSYESEIFMFGHQTRCYGDKRRQQFWDLEMILYPPPDSSFLRGIVTHQ